MTLLKDNNYKDINVALLSLEADIKNKTGFDTSVIDKQLAEINSRIDKINAGGNNSSAVINDIRTEIEDINSKLNANSVRIESIEQKLSDIFSAENKVTDFNTTTNSGIYYWVTDAANRPSDYGVLLVNKYDGGDSASNLWINQIAYGTNNKIYFRQNINSTGWTEWKAVAFTTDIENTTTKTLNLNTVSIGTTKYIKLGTFHWSDKASLRCRLYGNSFEDDVNINILSGNANWASVCGYYSTNSMNTKAIIVKRGDNWNSDIEIYLQVTQLTTLNIDVTIDNVRQDRINISESTTAPSGKLETITFNNLNGMFTGNIEATGNFYGNLSGKADTADSLFYRQGNEINFKGGAPNQCWFNYRNADTGGPSPVDTMEYIFCNYSKDTSKSVIKAGTVKAPSKLVIPIGAPSYLEDGCIWIER